MGIRERLTQLEAARKFRRGPLRRIVRLEGQSDEQAWRLSKHRDQPLDDSCVILPEDRLRRRYREVWGDAFCKFKGLWADVYADRHMAKVRAEQDAAQILIDGGTHNGNS